MLSTPSEFPQAGSTAFLRGSAKQARILQRRADGTCLIALTARQPRAIGASATRTVPLSDLFETVEEAALARAPRPRKRIVA